MQGSGPQGKIIGKQCKKIPLPNEMRQRTER